MLAPADGKPEGTGGVVTAINIMSIPVGAFLVGDPLRVATEEEARLLTGASAPLMLDHQSKEVLAAPVEIMPEIEIVDEAPTKPDECSRIVIRSASLDSAERSRHPRHL